MRKMGWREGEGLGKNKEGNKEPILVDFKTDRKGEFPVQSTVLISTINCSLKQLCLDFSKTHPGECHKNFQG